MDAIGTFGLVSATMAAFLASPLFIGCGTGDNRNGDAATSGGQSGFGGSTGFGGIATAASGGQVAYTCEREIHVATTGSDSATGTASAPFKTIAKAGQRRHVGRRPSSVVRHPLDYGRSDAGVAFHWRLSPRAR
jgi:hypothetical protein